eukprot:m.168823 g.168823  ORF g.168823 m.168823 type:complete len:243 (+) comp16657_c0_seq4:1342-2070(+)
MGMPVIRATLANVNVSMGFEVGGLGANSADAAKSCRHLNLITYWLNPTGSSSFQAYCLQSDGGGWMKILEIPGQDYLVSTGAISSIHLAAPGTSAKLSDTHINSVVFGASSTEREYRFEGPQSSDKVYLRSSATYIDTRRAFNIFTGTRSICQKTSYASCTFRASTYATLDTLDDSAITSVNNDCSRFFTDHSTSRSCWGRERVGDRRHNRCLSTGQTCVVGGVGNHPPIQGTKIYVRQRSL